MSLQLGKYLPAAAEPGLDAWRPDAFEITEVACAGDSREYLRLLVGIRRPVALVHPSALPPADSRCFRVHYRDELVAMFRLSAVADSASPYYRRVTGAVAEDGGLRRLVEIDHCVIAAAFRDGVLLGLMLQRAMCSAIETGADFIVATAPHQALRLFVDFGAMPVDHPPLPVAGREQALDFVVCYDLRTPESRSYLQERASRYLDQRYALKCIQDKYLRPNGAAKAALT